MLFTRVESYPTLGEIRQTNLELRLWVWHTTHHRAEYSSSFTQYHFKSVSHNLQTLSLVARRKKGACLSSISERGRKRAWFLPQVLLSIHVREMMWSRPKAKVLDISLISIRFRSQWIFETLSLSVQNCDLFPMNPIDMHRGKVSLMPRRLSMEILM